MLSSTITSNVNFTDFPAFTSTFSHIIEFFSALYPLTFVSFILVPSGIASVTVTFPSAFPLFVSVIVYVNVSPTFADFLSTDFAPVMFATFVSVGFVGVLSSITAVFVTDVFLSLLIVTLNETSAVFPAFTSTSFHVIIPFDSTPLFVIESATSVVPVGTSSVTVTFPSPSPLFVNVIVYVNSSPTFASVLSADFLPVIFATFVSTSSVGVFPIVAVLLTDFTSTTSSPIFVVLFTTTSKLTETSPFAGTTTLFHVIVPFSLSKFPFPFILPSTKVVPSGMISFITVVPSTSVVFFAVIVYLIVSPTFASLFSRTSSLFTIVTTCAVLFAVITGVFVSGVSSPFTFAMLLIKSIESAVTTTLNDTVTVSPAFISFFHTIFPSLFSAPPSEIEANSVPSGIESIVRIPFASSFPLFVIFIT